jgi:uncharacterized protein
VHIGIFKRAAIIAALFVFLPIAALAVVPRLFVSDAFAKMRLDKLAIEKAGDGSKVSFDVEIAVTDQEKSVGLMFRTALADTAGMLFPYGRAHDVSMWMRNTYIPLDMLFIREDGVIHRIEVRTEPMSERVIAAGAPVTAVLELAGGATERLGIKAGDRVRHPLFDAANGPK